MTNYLLSWHYTGPCTIDAQSFLLEGTARSHVLHGLQEGGNYYVSLFAVSGVSQGPTATVSVTTEIIGRYIFFECHIDSYIREYMYSLWIDPLFLNWPTTPPPPPPPLINK